MRGQEGQGGSKMSDAYWKVLGPWVYRFISVREPNSNKLQTGWEWQTLNLNIQFANFSWDSSRSWQQYFGFIIVQTSLKISQTISLGLVLVLWVLRSIICVIIFMLFLNHLRFSSTNLLGLFCILSAGNIVSYPLYFPRFQQEPIPPRQMWVH